MEVPSPVLMSPQTLWTMALGENLIEQWIFLVVLFIEKRRLTPRPIHRLVKLFIDTRYILLVFINLKTLIKAVIGKDWSICYKGQ